MTQHRTLLRRLRNSLKDADNVLIVPHNNPDPDAIASSVALAYLLDNKLGITSKIAYKGIVGRAENRAMTRYLNHPLQPLKLGDLQKSSHIVLIDTQPGFGNNPLAVSDPVAAVIDHHQIIEEAKNAHFVDIRPEVGASSTMLVEYLRAAKLPFISTIATALFYGIKTDTMALQRGASPEDHKAFCYLLPFVDFEAIARIERAQVSIDYFRTLVETLQSTMIYDYIITSHIPVMRYPDLTADMADLLLRTRGCRWVFCSGIYKDILYFSIRTENKRRAGQIAREIVGDQGTAGGHGSMAGGQLSTDSDDLDELALNLRLKFLQNFSISPEQSGESLL